MSVRLSTALASAMMSGSSLKALLDAGFIYIYDGPVPATGDGAIDVSCDLVGKVTESDDGTTGLTFATPATNGVLQKDATEVWSTTALASTTMTFFRYCVGADDGSGVAGGSDYRIQGTIGPDMSFDLFRPNPAVTASDTITLNSFQIQQPLG